MNISKIAVLGAGLVGKAIAIDLSTRYEVTSFDLNQERLDELKTMYFIDVINIDLSNADLVSESIKEFDLIVLAVPGYMGFKTLEAIIKSGKNVVDISFFPEDCFLLDELAKNMGVTAIVDCGVAPGMGNIFLGYHNANMKVNNYECYVGGLPFERNYPFQYKAPFSPIDVIEEYTRPSRIVINNVIMIKEALSEPELMYFEGIGSLEAFNTDGLRSLTQTMNIKDMKEKTLRYPGHIDLIKLIKSIGLFDIEEFKYKDLSIIPREFISDFLVEKWKLSPNEKEFTVMKVIIEGFENEEPKRYVYDLFDQYDEKTGISSMARTTGYTATSVVDLVLQNKITKKGILPPELIGDDEYVYKYILNYQKQRGINYKINQI